MERSGIRVAGALALTALLGGCVGSPGGTMPPGTPVAALHQHVWMDGDLKGQDLLYVTNLNGLVNVYTYWTHKLVGVLTNFTSPYGACVGKGGVVYIVDYNAKNISEYAHGGTKPLKVIDDSPNNPFGCAVDRATGNLAVANYNEGYGGNLAIYIHGVGKPTTYAGAFTSCAYDDRGDLLATAQYGYYDYYTEFNYLPKDSTQLLSIDLPGSRTSGWLYVQSIEFDGKYWVVDSYDQLFRYLIDIKAQLIDTIRLSGGDSTVGELAIYRKTYKVVGTQAVGATGGNQAAVNYWKYPAGGNPYHQITGNLANPAGVAISLKQ